uniref:Retrotransposon gag domain-containing protein n=1 Tax=Strongyloides venezuelensis TaxID=75913 RepID=A0A0K0FS48_STRVS
MEKNGAHNCYYPQIISDYILRAQACIGSTYYQLSGRRNFLLKISHVKEITEEVEAKKSSTGKKLLPSVMLLATQYAKLKSKIDSNDNNNKNILLFNDTLSSINKTLNTTNGRGLKLIKSGDIRRFLEEYKNIIEDDQERAFEIENHLRGATKLAYFAIKKKHTLSWDELKNTLIEKYDPEEGRLSSLEVKQRLRQITPQDKETGKMFLLRIESQIEKFEETTNVVLSNGKLFEIIVFLLKKTSVNGKMHKYYKQCDNNIESLKKEFLKMAREMYVKPKEIHKTGNDNQRKDKKNLNLY